MATDARKLPSMRINNRYLRVGQSMFLLIIRYFFVSRDNIGVLRIEL